MCHKDLCTVQNVYHPESHAMRYCTRCARWYHICCLRPRGTIASIRMDPETEHTPWWTVWTPPPGIPSDIADLLVRLVTMPMQCGHQDLGGGIHPLLSFEKFTDTLRCMFEERDIVLPATPGDSEHLMRRLLEMSVAGLNEHALSEADAAIRWLADQPLDQRIIYFCPRREVHFL